MTFRPSRRALLVCAPFVLIVSACALARGRDIEPYDRLPAKTVRLTLLHTNDTHGHLLPYNYPETFDKNSELMQLVSVRNIGGAARRATLVKRIRAERGHSTLLLDAGDLCDGTPFSTEYHGDADVAAMNAIGYDFACPGNHEFNNTLEQVIHLRASATFPVLCANATLKVSDKPLYLPYTIKVVDGARVAVFGLTTYDGRTYPAAKENMNFEPPIEAAKRLVPQLRKQADFVVAVTHIGVNEDQKLALEVPGIDVIVGGHSHTMVPRPLYVASTSQNGLIRPTIIVQNFQWGGTLGRLDLTLHRSEFGSWRVDGYRGELLPVVSSVPEDPEVAKVVSSYWDPIKAKYGAMVGEATADFTSKGNDDAEYNLVADAVREMMGAEFGIENAGGVRAPLIRGTITFGDMVTMDPFGNTVVTFKATGRQIKEMLARGRPAVSGIRYRLEAGTLTEATLGGKPIEDDRVYSGVTNSYWAAQPLMSGVSDKVDTKKPRLDLVIEYIKAHGKISPAYDGRRVIRSAASTP